MVNKQEIADSLQVPITSVLDATRYIRLSGSQEDNGIFRAPYACKLISCVMRAETIEVTNTSTTIALKKAASGTAMASGTDIITPVNASSGLVAATDLTCSIDTDNNTLAEGDTVGAVIGTTSELAGLVYTVAIERL